MSSVAASRARTPRAATPQCVSGTNDSAEESRRAALRSFLRSRRTRLSPVALGLPAGGRRRANGLRREDVAEIAGVSLGWYARFELGQLTNVSERLIDSISDALKLDETERNYLRALARPLPAHPEPGAEIVPEMLRFVVESYMAGPAVLLGARLDLLAVNDIARLLELGSDHAGLESNIAWRAFVDPSTRDRVVDGDQRRRELAAILRYSYARHVGEPSYDELITAMSEASSDFLQAWESFEVRPLKFDELQLSVDGEVVTLSTIVLTAHAAPGQSVVLMRPTDGEHFDRLVVRLRTR
jgi:transcriptional regulator with XRE-family HTH domain